MKVFAVVLLLGCALLAPVIAQGERCCRYNCKKGDKICPTTIRKLGNVNVNGVKFFSRIQKVSDGMKNLEQQQVIKVPSNYSIKGVIERSEAVLNASIYDVKLGLKNEIKYVLGKLKATTNEVSPATCDRSNCPSGSPGTVSSDEPPHDIRTAEASGSVSAVVRSVSTTESGTTSGTEEDRSEDGKTVTTPSATSCYIGIADGTINLSDLSASSEHAQFPLSKVRLNSKPGAWCPDTGDENPWVQVDLKSTQAIAGVVTQGKPNSDRWVLSYEVWYGDEDSNVTPYQEDGSTKVFAGNTDRSTPVTNRFSVTARYIRVVPKTHEFRPCMRIELLRC